MNVDEESIWRGVIIADQSVCDACISTIVKIKRRRKWFLGLNMAINFWNLGSAFYKQQYWWGIFYTLFVMCVVAILWTLDEIAIARRRYIKRCFAEHKLWAQANLKKVLERKERGFE